MASRVFSYPAYGYIALADINEPKPVSLGFLNRHRPAGMITGFPPRGPLSMPNISS